LDIPETVLFERDRGVSSKLFRPLGQIPDITKPCVHLRGSVQSQDT